MAGICAAPAVTIKKAPSVTTQKASATDSAKSLVPTVLGVVGAVKDFTAKQAELTAECTPTQAEVDWVNKMFKEWIQTGVQSADDIISSISMVKCERGPCYANRLEDMKTVEGTPDYVDVFTGDAGAIWDGYPMASVATYCKTGSCTAKDKKTESNIWTIYALIDFSDADYSASEATMHAKLSAKYEKCSSYAVSSKQKLLQNSFLNEMVGSIGQKTNTGSIMETVSGLSGSGLGGLGSIGSLATQFLDK